MIKAILFVAFLVVISATPRALQVQETAHQIAKSVKSSSDYSLEEKEEILANLKAINNDAKSYQGAHGHKKAQLKEDLHEKLAALKTQMHEEPQHLALEEDEEDEEERDASKISKIHNEINAVKSELKTKTLTKSQKVEAKKLIHKLEQEYSELSQASKSDRKEIAREMKSTVHDLHKFFDAKEKKPSLQSRKEKLLSLVKSTEKEYSEKSLGSYQSKINAAFEEMKSEIKQESNAKALKNLLKSKLQTIRSLEARATTELEEAAHAEEEEEEKSSSEKQSNDLEESVEDDE